MTDESEAPSKAIPLGLFTIHGDPAPLFAALAKAQAAFEPIVRAKTVTVKTKDGRQYTFDYAPLDVLIRACTPALSANDLAIWQPFTRDSDGFTLRTILSHKSGAYVEAIIDGPNGDGWQVLGSALTYARRYAYSAITGTSSEDDDDGNAADGHTVTQATSRATPPSAPKTAPKPAQAAKPKDAPKAPPAKPAAEPEPENLPPEAYDQSEPEDAGSQADVQLATPETHAAIAELLKAKYADKLAGRARIREILNRDAIIRLPNGRAGSDMTEAEGCKVIAALKNEV